MDRVDVCLVIGANDVVNPPPARKRAARSTACRSSKPTLQECHRDETLDGRRFCRHRKPPVHKDNTRMLFGDAKNSLQALITAVKAN